jgi:hypothetical protein
VQLIRAFGKLRGIRTSQVQTRGPAAPSSERPCRSYLPGKCQTGRGGRRCPKMRRSASGSRSGPIGPGPFSPSWPQVRPSCPPFGPDAPVGRSVHRWQSPERGIGELPNRIAGRRTLTLFIQSSSPWAREAGRYSGAYRAGECWAITPASAGCCRHASARHRVSSLIGSEETLYLALT